MSITMAIHQACWRHNNDRKESPDQIVIKHILVNTGPYDHLGSLDVVFESFDRKHRLDLPCWMATIY